LSAASVCAAQTPYVAAVIPTTAEVRCKPSPDAKLYPTNRLSQGTRVLVLEERGDGWLGIQPPAGSFSWINVTQVERIVPNQTNWVVKNDNTPALIGSALNEPRPTVEGMHLARGTQVRSVGMEVRDTDGSVWLPIDPPAGELRYIRVEAVKADPGAVVQAPAAPRVGAAEQTKPTSAFTVSRTTDKDLPLSIAAQTMSATAPPAAGATPWQQAEYYERQGQWQEAIRIYDQLAKAVQTTHPDWATFATKRADYLRSGGRAPINWSSSTQSTVDQRSSTFQPAAQPAQQPQARLSPPVDPNASTSPTTQQTASWSSPQATTQTTTRIGTLVRSGYYGTRGPQYRLSTTNDAPSMIYLYAGQGVDLERYVDRGTVEVSGTWNYSGELKGYYLVVSNVRQM
jgi:hypothetical protein